MTKVSRESINPDKQDVRLERIQDALSKPDYFTAIVLSEAFIETCLNRIVEHQIVSGKEKSFAKARFTVQQLTTLANCFGWIPDSLTKFLYRFYELRNKYAHDVDYKFTFKDVSELNNLFEDTQAPEWLIKWREHHFTKTAEEQQEILMHRMISTIIHRLDAYYMKHVDRERLDRLSIPSFKKPIQSSELQRIQDEIAEEQRREMEQWNWEHAEPEYD